MAQSWHSVVDGELSAVDSLLRSEVRSAYPELNRMCEMTLTARYHEIRPALCLLSYFANGGKDSKRAVAIAACLETVFDGLHLHDTIGSDGKVRGEKKKLFSKEPSTTKVIVAGDFMYVIGFRQAYSGVPELVPYLMRATDSIGDAIFRIVDRSHDTDVPEDECLEISQKKGAVEFQILMESAAKLAGATEEAVARMSECGCLLGMAIQISYDVGDLLGYEGESKPRMESLLTGYPTVPLYHLMHDDSVGAKVKEAFSSTDLSIREALAIVSSIRESKAILKCREMIDDYVRRAVEVINSLPDSEYKNALLKFSENASP